MRLERCTFPVTQLKQGSKTNWEDGVLEFDVDELTNLVLEDPNVLSVNFDATSPGDSARIINWRDFVEPMIKIEGPGTVYPGVMGRPVQNVGSGKTYRLGGMSVVQCADPINLTTEELTWPPVRRSSSFFDMSGPGGQTPYSKLHNLCLTIVGQDGLNAEDWHTAMTRATLKVSDRLAQVLVNLDPPETEIFDMEPAEGLPNVVSIFNLASDEWFCGAQSVLGTSIYGQTRLSAPWALSPTELFDGGVYHSGHLGTTWMMTNNPVALKIAREHGKTCNYVGALIGRTNWTRQSEKDMAADRLAQLAVSLGAKGAILTTDIRGQRFVETILGVTACEKAGIPTVLLTEEEDNEGGTAPPLLMSSPEVTSVVSASTGGQEELFPAVDRVIGAINSENLYEPVHLTANAASENAVEDPARELPGIHGAYGGAYFRDNYGYGLQGAVDY